MIHLFVIPAKAGIQLVLRSASPSTGLWPVPLPVPGRN